MFLGIEIGGSKLQLGVGRGDGSAPVELERLRLTVRRLCISTFVTARTTGLTDDQIVVNAMTSSNRAADGRQAIRCAHIIPD